MKNTALAFDSHRLWCDPFPLRNAAYQRFRLVDVKIIHDQMPLRRFLIAGNQPLEMREGILLGARRPPRRLADSSADDIKVDKPGQRPMPAQLKLPPQHPAWLHAPVRRLSLSASHPVQPTPPA